MRLNRPALRRLALAVAVAAAMPAFAVDGPGAAPSGIAEAPAVHRPLLRLSTRLDDVFTASLGLKPLACRFRNSVDGRAYRHPGIGPCLYRSWRAGQRTDGIPGVIDALVKPVRGSGEPIGLRLEWRSAEGNLITSISRLLKMRGDRGLPESMRGQTFLGTVTVAFDRPIDPATLLGPVAGLFLQYRGKGVTRIELDTSHDAATGRETHGTVLFFVEGESEPAFELELRTDANLLKKRGFFLELEGR